MALGAGRKIGGGGAVARKVVARPSLKSTPRVPRREPPAATHLLSKTRELFPSPWVLVSNVRNEVGVIREVLRTADAILVYTGPGGWRFVGLEVKRSRSDLRRELRNPRKSAAHLAICGEWYLVVPAPWTDYLLTLDELPPTWGLIEVGTGGARFVVDAELRDVDSPTDPFLKALYRAAAAADERLDLDDAAVDVGAPLRTVARYLSRAHAALQCLHTVGHPPLAKTKPARVACYGCRDGLPSEPEAVVAAIEDADAEQLAVYRVAVDRRARELVMDWPKAGVSDDG